MRCELCLDRTSVHKTRKPAGQQLRHTSAHRLVDWYSPDGFVARERTCSCGHRFNTVEVEINDLDEMFAIISREGLAVLGKPE